MWVSAREGWRSRPLPRLPSGGGVLGKQTPYARPPPVSVALRGPARPHWRGLCDGIAAAICAVTAFVICIFVRDVRCDVAHNRTRWFELRRRLKCAVPRGNGACGGGLRAATVGNE